MASVTRKRRREPVKSLLKFCKDRARVTGREFALTLADIIVPELCPVLGIPLRFGVGFGRGKGGKDHAPSIDRIDNARGYTPDNIIIVSFRANRIKNDASVAELEAVAAFYGRLERDRAASCGV